MSELTKFFAFDLQRFQSDTPGEEDFSDKVSSIKPSDDKPTAAAGAPSSTTFYWSGNTPSFLPQTATLKATATQIQYEDSGEKKNIENAYEIKIDGTDWAELDLTKSDTLTVDAAALAVLKGLTTGIKVASGGEVVVESSVDTSSSDFLKIGMTTPANIKATKGYTYTAGSSPTITVADNDTTFSATGDAKKLIIGDAAVKKVTVGSNEYNIEKSGGKAYIVLDGAGADSGFCFATGGDAVKLAAGASIGLYYDNNGTATEIKNVALTAAGEMVVTCVTKGSTFKVTPTNGDQVSFGKTPLEVEATAVGTGDAITFTKDGVLSSVVIGADGEYSISDGAKVDLEITDVTASGTSSNTVEVKFSDNATVSEIAVGSKVTAASIAVGANAANLIGKDVKIAGGTVNVNCDYTYTIDGTEHTIELTNTGNATEVEVASYGKATIIKPAAALADGLTIGETTYKFTMAGSGATAAYFYTGGTNVGYVFMQNTDSITVKAGTTLDLYDGGHTSTDKIGVSPTVTGVDFYTISRTGTDTYAITVTDGAHVELGGTKLDCTVNDPANGELTIAFNDKGVVTSIVPGTTAATAYSIKVEGAPADGIQIGAAQAANLVDVVSGKFTYEVTGSSNPTILTLTEGTDTVEAVGVATNGVHVIPGASGTVTFNTGTTAINGAFTYVNKSSEAYFDVAAANNGFYFGGKDDAITFDDGTIPANNFAMTTGANGAVTFDAAINNKNKKFTVTLSDDTSGSEKFEVSELVKRAVYNDGAADVLTFGDTADGGKLYFGNDGTGTVKLTGADAATGDKITFNAAQTAGSGVLYSSETDSEKWFQLDGKGINIDLAAAAGALVYDSSDKSLKGTTAASAVTVTDAGVVKKIFAPVATAPAGTEFTFGADQVKYTAGSTRTNSPAFFTVDGDKATGFAFVTTNDFLTTAAANLASFNLQDGADGKPFSAPTVTDDTGAAKSGDLTITKVTAKINNVDTNGFSLSVEAEDIVTFDDKTKLTFGDTVDANGAAVYFGADGKLLCVTGISELDTAVTVANASGSVFIGKDPKKVEAIDITGSGSWTYQMVDDGKGTAVPAIKDLTSGVKVVQSGSVKELWTAPGKDGEFTFGEKAFTIAGATADTTPAGTGVAASVEGGVRFDWDGTNKKVTGIASIDDKTSIKGALNGLKFNDYAGTGTALAITGGDSTTYTLFGGGLSLAGLKSGEAVTATGGISTFITDGIGKFTILKTGMSIASDSDNKVMFVTNGVDSLTGIASLNGSAIGDFAGGLSVNNVAVQVTGDSSVAVVGDDKTVTAINQLGVTDAATAINVSASGVTTFGVDLNGKFDFNGAASFGVAGNGTEVTVFNLGTSAITGVDATETLSGNFENAFTVNGNALQVAGDSSISVVGGTQILGLTAGASVAQAAGFSSAKTDETAFTGTFQFGGQSFNVTSVNGVEFQLKDGKVVGISGIGDGEVVTGDLNGVIINGKEPEIIVQHADGSNNTNLTYQNGTLSGIVDGDTVVKADNVTTIIAGDSGAFKFNGGQSFVTSDADGIVFTVTPGTTTVTAIDSLAADASLEGSIGGLSVNGKTVDIQKDDSFGVVGATTGINGIYKLSDGAIVVDAAGATVASTDSFGTFTFAGGQSFVTAGDSTVDFTLDKSAVTAITGLSAGSVLGSFSGIQVNSNPINVVDADNKVEVFADDKGALSKIDKVTGGASIGEIGSVSQILTDKAGLFSFNGGQSFTTTDDTVTFGMSSSKVTSISDLSGSVTGSFSGITVNGTTIDIKDADNVLTVIGDGTKLTAIQGVDADATINAAGSVAQLVGNISASSGTFTFKDNGAFVIAGDSSVTFALDTSAAAKVTGISGIDGPATVTGGLSQVAFNGNSMSVAGDADNQFSYMLDAAGKATLGGVGGEKVTVSGVGGANFVQITEQGDYNFFGMAYGLSLASGESSVLFGTDGKQVTSVADLEGTLQGDFSAAGFTVNGKEFEIAGDSSVGIVGSGSGVTKIVDLSGGANVKGVGGASVAITDSEGKFTFTNGSFSIAGDADGVTFMLEGDKVVGIKDLDTGATLTGSLDQLANINGAKLDIKDDDNFGVVGATSGISKVVDLSTPANVVNAGGASQALANTGETFTFPNGTFTISGYSTATFDLDAKTSEVTNIKVVSGATVSGPLNGIAINGGASLNVVGDTVFGAVAGDSKLAQLINLSGGANVVGAGGASQFVTDSEGEFTILSTAMEISGDDSVMFTAGTSGITAIDSLEGTAIGDFNNVIAVNGENDVQILGDSSIEVTSDGTAVTAINAVTGSDAPTIAAVGGATEIGTDAAGTFTFTTGGDSKAFTVGEDDEVTFTLEDGAVTGVNALEDGTLGFKDVTDLSVNETALTIESTQNVSLSIADSAVVYVKGVDGEIGGLENATVAATGAMTVNGMNIDVQGDDDYKVIVQDGAVVGLTDVSDGATVNVAGVSIAVDSSGDFQIGGNDYTFTDENNAFTLTTGDDSQLSGVDELEGNVVIANPSTQSLTVNDDELAFASGADSVTVAAGASGITAVNGLIDKDGVTVAAGASIAMLGSTASVSTEGAQLKVNEVTYTLLNDADGITVTGGREVTGLDENASLYVSEKGKYTVNGNGSDIEVEDTAMPIIGLDNATDAYIYDPANLIVRKGTPVSSIEQMLGLTTEYPADPNFGTADDPLTSAEVEAVFGASSTADLDKPIETFATNETKDPQDINLANTDFSKKVHLFDGPQSVEFNNFGGNEAIIERENPDGSATGGEKAITLGNGGDAVIMKADAGNGSAANVTGGTGDDSIVVQGSAPVNFDMSAGGDDKIVTFASSGARVALNGYDALANPNAGIHITERWASIANAILTGLLSFGDGVLNINSASGDTAKIEFAGHTDPVGAVLVNLFDYLGRKQAVGFTNSGGGLADFSAAVEPMILIGNDGNKTGGSSLLGGSGDDTAFAGGGDEIDLGLGNNEIVLDPNQNREGAGIALTRGRTTIDNFNGTFNLDHGDVIATDLSAANISFRDGNVYIEGDGFYGVIANAKPDGAISYDEALTESADEAAPLGTKSGDYTNVLFNNAGVLVKTAIAKEGGVMDVKLDQDQRALNYIGDNSGLTFYDHTGEVLVNLAEGNGSIDTADALFSGINSVAAGAGQTTIIGADDNETLIAGTGTGSIWGAGGDNLMRGNTDSGKTGQTSFFVVAEKDGARNTIESFNFVTDDNYTNTNKITADKLDIQVQYDQIQTENGGVAISGNDVVLLVNNRNEAKAESVIIKDAVGKDFIVSGDDIIDDVIAQVNVDKLTADKFANYFVATGKNATLTVSDEFDKANIYLDNETPLGSDHEGEIPQFYGDFKVIDATGSNAKVELGGNELDNTILAGTGDSSLWGGNGGNDLLVGGAGKNSFFYNYGNGNDTIQNVEDGDVIDLTNISLDDIVDANSAIGDNGVKLQFTDGNTLTVEGTAGEYLIGDDTYVVEDGKWSKKA